MVTIEKCSEDSQGHRVRVAFELSRSSLVSRPLCRKIHNAEFLRSVAVVGGRFACDFSAVAVQLLRERDEYRFQLSARPAPKDNATPLLLFSMRSTLPGQPLEPVSEYKTRHARERETRVDGYMRCVRPRAFERERLEALRLRPRALEAFDDVRTLASLRAYMSGTLSSHPPPYRRASPRRMHAFVADVANGSDAQWEAVRAFARRRGGLDVVTLVFVLSALEQDAMPRAVRRLSQLLKPGGLLFFRDYGAGDLAQKRFDDKRAANDADDTAASETRDVVRVPPKTETHTQPRQNARSDRTQILVTSSSSSSYALSLSLSLSLDSESSSSRDIHRKGLFFS